MFQQFRKIHPKLQKKKNYQETKKNIKPNSSSNYDDYHNNGRNHNEVVQYENRYNSSYQNNNDVCNRKKWVSGCRCTVQQVTVGHCCNGWC